MKRQFQFIFGLFMALVAGCLFALILGIPPVYAVIGALLLSFIPQPKGVATATLLTQVFASDITKGLYPDNSFYKKSKDDSAWVDNDKVNLPQKGAAPNVVVDRTSLPATISQRTDTTEDYTLQEFTTDPQLIQHSEALVVAYDKRRSIVEDMTLTLNTKIADNFAVIFSPSLAANQVRTTGTARAAYATGATGTRKAITKADFIAAKLLLDRMEVPQEGRIAVLPASFMGDVLGISDFTDVEKFGVPGLPSGVVTRIMGFEVMTRSRVSMYDNTATPVKRALGSAGATTDNEGALFYHPQFVRRAEGAVKVFEDNDNPTLYGSVISSLVRAGGRIARTDQKGVVSVIETWVS
jgi:hypothetical protein